MKNFVLLIGPFCIHYPVCPINIVFWQGRFFRKCFILASKVLSTKKRFSTFSKKVFIFQKKRFKVKALKAFKISSDCHLKPYRYLKRRVIFKIPITVFCLRVYVFSLNNTCQISAVLLGERRILCLFHESRFHVTMEYKELNWLHNHFKKVRSSQASCTGLSRTVFPCEYR